MEQKDLEGLTIGSKIFVVHRDYAFKKKPGGKVLPAKVVAFHNVKGCVEIIFRITGGKPVDLTLDHYIPFVLITKAIDAIRS